MKISILFASLLVAGIAYGAEPVKPKETPPADPPPTIVTMDTGKEILRITHDGKIYSDGKLVTRKALTIATKQKAYEKCARLLLTQLEQN